MSFRGLGKVPVPAKDHCPKRVTEKGGYHDFQLAGIVTSDHVP